MLTLGRSRTEPHLRTTVGADTAWGSHGCGGFVRWHPAAAFTLHLIKSPKDTVIILKCSRSLWTWITSCTRHSLHKCDVCVLYPKVPCQCTLPSLRVHCWVGGQVTSFQHPSREAQCSSGVIPGWDTVWPQSVSASLFPEDRDPGHSSHASRRCAGLQSRCLR